MRKLEMKNNYLTIFAIIVVATILIAPTGLADALQQAGTPDNDNFCPILFTGSSLLSEDLAGDDQSHLPGRRSCAVSLDFAAQSVPDLLYHLLRQGRLVSAAYLDHAARGRAHTDAATDVFRIYCRIVFVAVPGRNI